MFTITLTETDVRTYTTKGRAQRAADGFAKTRGVKVTVVDSAGNVAHVATPVKGRRFKPGERVETPSFPAPAFTDWVISYTRKKIQAAVYQSEVHEGVLVHDGRTGGVEWCANTTVSRLLVKAMRQGAVIEQGKRPAILTQPAEQAA